MERRDFLKKGLAASALTATGTAGLANVSTAQANTLFGTQAKHTFKMKYAPHFGMFKNNAGDDPIKELQFMADMGFTALEDNGMMGRPVDVQEKIGKELQRLNMTMGVFVIDK